MEVGDSEYSLSSLDALVEELERKVDVSRACKEVCRLLASAKRFSRIENPRSPHAFSLFKVLYQDFITFQSTLNGLPRQEYLQTTVSQLEELMDDLDKRMFPKEDDSTKSTISPDAAPHPHKSKLKLGLPKFKGDILQWTEFWNLFQAVLKTAEPLSDFEKIYHLQEAMSCDTAKSIARLAAVGGSYDNVVEALENRYDKKRVVYAKHVEAIVAQGTIHDNMGDLARCIKECSFHYNGLYSADGGTLSQFMTALLSRLMDASCADHWANFIASKEGVPDFGVFQDFLEHRLPTLQSNPALKRSNKPPGNADRRPPAKSSGTSSHHPPFKPKSTVYTLQGAQEGYTDTCPICREAHSVYVCPTFKGLNVNKRTTVAKEKSLCGNCLGRGHSASSCKSKATCRECAGHHHTFLHRPTESPPATTLFSATKQANCDQTSVSGKTSAQTFCRTAMILASAGTYQQTARVMMDSGSTVTLITSQLANSLKAHRRRSSMIVQGLTGTSNIHHEVVVDLSSLLGREDGTIQIVAQVINQISSECPHRRSR